MEAIEKILEDYSKNEEIKDIRHSYSHFRKNNKLYLIDLWSEVIALNPITELNKAIDFLKLLSRIIQFSKPCLEHFAKKEHERVQNELLSPLEDMFTKAIVSCRSRDERENLLKYKEEFKNLILDTLNRQTNSQLKKK